MDGQVIQILTHNDFNGIDTSLDQYETTLFREKDERDEIQTKTFTKWINKHLIKSGRRIVDLYEDLRDGEHLISLLEVLSQELMPRERGRMRIHMLQNVQTAINFLKKRKIKLVNVRPEDVVDSNQKIVLGLIWTIILHYQISDIIQHDETITFKEVLLKWAQKTTEGYPGVNVSDFTSSWKDGLAFNAVINRNRPDLLDFKDCKDRTARQNLEAAFSVAEKELGITRLLEADDVVSKYVDEKSMITYLSSFYELWPEPADRNPLMDDEKMRRIDEYKAASTRLVRWIKENTTRLNSRDFGNTLNEIKEVQKQHDRFRTEEIPPKNKEKQRLAYDYKEVVRFSESLGRNYIDHEFSSDNIEILWNRMMTAVQERDQAILKEMLRLEKLKKLAEKLMKDIRQTDMRLDDIERKIVEEEKRFQTHPQSAKFNADQIESDLRVEGEHIKSMFDDVKILSNERYHRAPELESQVKQLHQKWSNLKINFQDKIRLLSDLNLHDIQKWLDQMEKLLTKNLDISCRFDILKNQYSNFEKIYREALDKENEVHHVLNRGVEMVSKSNETDTRTWRNKLEGIKNQYQRVKKLATDRYIRLQKCLEKCKRYHQIRDSFVHWLDLCEVKLSNLQELCCDRPMLEKQMKELQQIKHEVIRHSQEFEDLKDACDNLLSCCDIDKEDVRHEMAEIKRRWEELNKFISERTSILDCIMNKLIDYQEKARNLANRLQPIEDRLKSMPDEPKSLDRIRGLVSEAEGLEKDLDKTRASANDLINKCGRDVDTTPIKNEMAGLENRYRSLLNNLKDRNSALSAASEVLNKFTFKVDSISDQLNHLKERLEQMEPIAREISILERQEKEMRDFNERLNKVHVDIEEASRNCNDLISKGYITDTHGAREIIDALYRKYNYIDEKAKKRTEDIKKMIEKLQKFYSDYQDADRELKAAFTDDSAFKPIGHDVEAIRNQQQEFKSFIRKKIEPLSRKIEELIRVGNGLIQSSAPGVATIKLEQDVERINEKWNDLKEKLHDRERRLEEALLQSGRFHEALSAVEKWLQDKEDMAANQKPPSADYKTAKNQIQEQKLFKKMLLDREGNITSLINMGKDFMKNLDSRERHSIEQQLDNIVNRYENLVKNANERLNTLESVVAVARQFAEKLAKLEDWLETSERKLQLLKTIPTDQDKIRQRIAEHRNLHQDILNHKRDFEELTEIAQNLIRLVGDNEATMIVDRLREVTDRYAKLIEDSKNLVHTLADHQETLNNFGVRFDDILAWIDHMDARLNKLRVLSIYLDKLRKQVDELMEINNEIRDRQKKVDETIQAGKEVLRRASGDDANQIRSKLDSLQANFKGLKNKAADKLRQAQDAIPIAESFHSAHERLNHWMDQAERDLKSIDSLSFIAQEATIQRIESEVSKNRSFLENIMQLGPQLGQISPGQGAAQVESWVTKAVRRFEAICEKLQRQIEKNELSKKHALLDMKSLMDWLDQAKSQLSLDNLYGDLDTVNALIEQHKRFQEEFRNQSKNLASARQTAQDFIQNGSGEDIAAIRKQLSSLESKWDEVASLSDAKQRRLEDAIRKAEDLHKAVHSLLEWLSDAEVKLRSSGLLPDNEEATRQLIAEHERFMREMYSQEKKKDSTIALATDILSKCHPDAIPVIRHWIQIIQSRWDEVFNRAKQKEQRLKDHLASLRNVMDILEELLEWLRKAETKLLKAEAEPLPDDVPSLQRLIDEHQLFIDELRAKEPEIDKALRAFVTKRTGAVQKGKRISTQQRLLSGKYTDANFKNSKARELSEKFKSVWDLAMDRMRRLKERLNYIKEFDKLRNFDFDEWRRRFLGWLNNRKARVMDFFRDIDTDNDGKVTLDEFIEGFLASSFPTSRMEMGKVAPIFDRNKDGFIDQQEYLDTLRPDREIPKTEDEIIQDEVQRQVAKCTCIDKYKVYYVGEGRYRFGESQKLRLVRILRSTVMVRVGGGWVSLDEFLIKNDPCRAKGRTNIELRERFILADGVSQGMAAFKSKPLVNPNTGEINSVGPITKVREKTERSIPMSGSHRFADQYTTDYSFNETESGTKSRPRSRLTLGSSCYSRPSSRSHSRNRAASDMSSESLDNYQRPSSRTRTPSCGRTNGVKERWK